MFTFLHMRFCLPSKLVSFDCLTNPSNCRGEIPLIGGTVLRNIIWDNTDNVTVPAPSFVLVFITENLANLEGGGSVYILK